MPAQVRQGAKGFRITTSGLRRLLAAGVVEVVMAALHPWAALMRSSRKFASYANGFLARGDAAVMRREFWLAVAAYILPSLLLGFLWHLWIFKANYDALQIYRPEVLIPVGVASMLIQGLIIAWLYPKLFSTARRDWLVGGAKLFCTIGVLSWSFIVLPVAAKFDMTSVGDFVVLETGFEALQFLMVSPLIALAWRASD